MRLASVAILAFCTSVGAQAALTTVSDGPYLFHGTDGSVIAKWVDDGKLRQKKFAKGAPVELPEFVDLIGKKLRLHEHRPQACVWKQPKKLLAISDVEGAYELMRRFLVGNGVIDSRNAWKFGKGHLVCVGDFVDRGSHVTETLWLLYRLAGEARAAGGQVHFVLGNHEVMMMGGDVRYTAPKYKVVAGLLGVPTRGLLGADTELGRWLRSCNTIARIGEIVFVHAGVSPSVATSKVDLAQLNDDIRGILGTSPEKIEDKRIQSLSWRTRGPLWYRGYFPQFAALYPEQFGPRPTVEQIDKILQNLQGSTIVIGHTKVKRVTSLYGGRRVLAIDIPWTKANNVRGLLVQDRRMDVVDIRGKSSALPE